ncbi:UPF0759 protein [Planktothrix tepida]|uniref:DUF72 domain-containing protein n=2 Tax=Planktothrix TaxID=54304 RepID=A0A1J1LS63_9CYAN|nr:DUF72 domain-containing protein [Planktothrix tepida]CAD5960231.1 UPF0759 protein [Planktothrix tepida]CUR34692.1 conserved hypothetical protein [Planktothrix tepida PCC 9214]
MVQFYLGCAVWSYKNWVGELYPVGSRVTDFLSLYSRRFNTVEGNTTFYAVPNAETVTRWVQQTPPNFKFCLKLPKDLTHQGLLKLAIPGALSFIEQMQLLGTHLGPIFAQLPPSYSPNLLEDLQEFIQAWPHQIVPLAVEVRHPEWFEENNFNELKQLLESYNVGRVILDSRPIYSSDDDPQLNSERPKPNVPVEFSITSSFSLVRFISHPQLSINQPFLEDWITPIHHWLNQGKDVYFFVHCPQEERSPSTAKYVQQLLEQHSVPISPLPWNQLEQTPIQLSLW